MTGNSIRRWSQQVTEHSDALDLDEGVFTLKDPRKIALSLKRSAEASERRKSDPFRLGHVDADLLHQSRGQEPIGQRPRAAGEG
jgi:hypothetical protein